MIKEKKIVELKKIINKLEKKDIDLIISDFDDTIFCRNKQLEDCEILRNNRGMAGNEKIFNEIGLENYLNKYYKNKSFPKDIVSKLRKGHDVIITAGVKELQENKLKYTGLKEHNYIVVSDAKNKIIETINYVINKLGFLPSKITVYEDRPKFFIENKELLENILGIPVNIMFVEMKDNKIEPKIKKVD